LSVLAYKNMCSIRKIVYLYSYSWNLINLKKIMSTNDAVMYKTEHIWSFSNLFPQ
jgi:hypothetical protein